MNPALDAAPERRKLELGRVHYERLMQGRIDLLQCALRRATSRAVTHMIVHDRELREGLMKALNDLTPEHKAVIVLRTVEGLSYKAIGEILGCSEGTVMSRLHYARKKLQEKLRAFL